MTVPQFETYTVPPMEESDEYKPRDNYGHTCIVVVNEHKAQIVTPNTKAGSDGDPGVIVDLVDLDVAGGTIYRNVLMMTGSIVDGFKAHVGTGKPLVVSWVKSTSKAGRDYASPAAATAEQVTRAGAYYTANGDPFAQSFESPTPAEDKPPF